MLLVRGVAEGKGRAARELNVEGGAENEVADDTNQHDSERNTEEDLLAADKVDNLSAAVELLADLLFGHLNVSLGLNIIFHLSHLQTTNFCAEA